MLLSAGLHSSRPERLREPVPGADWKHIRVYRHSRSPHHHQLPAGSAVQVQLQLPAGIPRQQHAGGLVSLAHIQPATTSFISMGKAYCVWDWKIIMQGHFKN